MTRPDPQVGDIVVTNLDRAYNTGRTLRITAVGESNVLAVASDTRREDMHPLWDVSDVSSTPAAIGQRRARIMLHTVVIVFSVSIVVVAWITR
jgi:hypothetical protein